MARLDGWRVLQLTDSYPPADGSQGRAVAQLSSALSRRGADVMVATLTPDPLQTPGVAVHRLMTSAPTAAASSDASASPGDPAAGPRPLDRATARHLNRLVAQFRPDVVHAHSWLVDSWLSIRHRWPEVRTVVSADDDGTFCPRPGTSGPGWSPELIGGTRRMAQHVDVLVASSAQVSARLAALIGLPAPAVIPRSDVSGAVEDTRSRRMSLVPSRSTPFGVQAVTEQWVGLYTRLTLPQPTELPAAPALPMVLSRLA